MKQAYVDDCPYYLDDFLTNMKVVKDRSDRTEEAYFIDIRTFLRYLNVKHHAVPAETPFNKIKIKERSYFPFKNTSCVLEIEKLIDHGLYIPNIMLEKGLRKTYEWYIKNKPKMDDKEMHEVDQVLKIV